jgi:hypothetical protein
MQDPGGFAGIPLHDNRKHPEGSEEAKREVMPSKRQATENDGLPHRLAARYAAAGPAVRSYSLSEESL